MQTVVKQSRTDYYTRAANDDCIKGGSRNRTKYSYDSLDRLNSATTSSTALTWTYDADGNRLTQAGGTGPATTVSSLTYNHRGRLISATTNLGAISALYNALGQRIEKANSTGATLFSYDEAGHLLGEYNSTGGLIEETVWMEDLPVATIQPNGTGGVNVFYIHADHLGTPKSIIQPGNNAIVWRWDQDPFGTATPNQNPNALGTFVYNLRFPGQYYDAETGLNYNYYRDLDTSTGRYIESDPAGIFGGSFSTYVYASGDPVIYIDPFGLCWVYSQSTGQLTHVDADGNSTYVGTGYAGYGAGLNNPAMQNVSDTGPLPQGLYTIQTQQDNYTHGPGGHKLPASMRLTPNPGNQMYGRAGFLIHGPKANDHQTSSNGCPVFAKNIRDQIGNSGDNCLQVVP